MRHDHFFILDGIVCRCGWRRRCGRRRLLLQKHHFVDCISLSLAMFLSPFKKKKKKKRNVFNISPPPNTELRKMLLRTYSASKTRTPSKLPIKFWMNNYKNLEDNWIRELLGQRKQEDSTLNSLSLCLLYCFFTGGPDNVFESGVGKAGQKKYCKTKCIEFFHEKFQEQYYTARSFQ